MGTDQPSAEVLGELHSVARRVAGRIVGSQAEAEDLAQEAVTRAIENWDRVGSYARFWAVRVATNLALADVRHRARVRLVTIDDAELAGPDTELRLDLRSAIARLPVRQRQATVLRYLADFDEATVASLLGCSRGTVKRHLHRAVRALRDSPALVTLPIADGTREKLMTTSRWSEGGYVPAAEPEQGWPPRPWDHWFISGPDGRVDRVAVRPDGTIILDGDGDEVMSGPGFGYEVVKVRPGSFGDLPEGPPEVPAGMAWLIERAAEQAAFHGHPWVGLEHLALTLCEHGALPAFTLDELDASIASFYEGPFAEARVATVRERRAGAAFAPPPETTVAWTDPLRETLETAVAEAEGSATPEQVADALSAKRIAGVTLP